MDFIVLLLLLSSVANRVESINGGRPPVITTHPNLQIAYKELESVELPCDASGFPKPQFFWEKDGFQLNLTNEFVQEEDSGNLKIIKATAATTDGVYRCFASNKFGVAVTQTAYLRKAELNTFPTAAPQSHFPGIGQKLTLTCKPPLSYPAASIYWGKSKAGSKLQSIENTERISLDYDGNLYFSNIEKGDYVEENQNYVCIAEQIGMLRTLVQGNDRVVLQPANDSAHFTYHPPALMWNSPSAVVAIREQTARMKCIFSGNPTPSVTWKRINSSPFPEKVKTESFGQELVIPKVNVLDAGLYQCTGNNTVTGPFISHNFTLKVEAAPYWRHGEAPKDITASEDETVEFECNADGSPDPTIEWTINGRPLSEAEPNSRRVISGNKIKFNTVEKNDSQVFQCLASNHHGSIMANAYLFVRAEKPSVLESLPKMTKVPEEKTVTLMCRMDGAPRPKITWHRGQDKEPVSGPRFRILPTGDLEITKPYIGDSDMYYCTGKNKFDEETAHGELVVRKKTVIILPPRNQSVNVSERVEFTCGADTDPNESSHLNVTWYKNDQPLSGGSTVIIGDRLIIDRVKVSDSGTFTCRADNKVDSSEADAELIVKDRPSPPTNIGITSCLSRKAALSWNASEDNNDPIVEYVVYYNASYDPLDGYHVGARVNTTSATVVNLKPWANYTFHVMARNGLGTSDRSAFSSGRCSISPDRPYSNPTGVCTRNGNPRELVITWEPLHRSDYNGEGFHYLVKYQRVTDDDVPVGENMSTKVYDDKELVVKNQEIYQRYRISVLAVNKVGSLPDRGNSFHYGYSSEGVPTVTPMNFRHDNETLNSTSVTFLWDPVDDSPESINGRFLGYRVFFWRQDYPDDVRTEDKSINPPAEPCPTGDSRRKHVRGRRSSDSVALTTHRLWGGSSIVASAVVVNGASTGERSNSIEFDTPEGVPDMVNTLDVVERGVHHLKIEWTAPLEINGKLKNYYAGYVDARGHQSMFHVDALRTTSKIHRLSPNSTYQIFIEARTSAGPGPRRYVEATTLPLSASPLDVPKIEETQLGDTFAVIKWRSSVHPKPKNPGSSFHVEYEIKDSKEVNRSEKETEHNWINLTDLDPGKQYLVAVVASNPSGESSRSDPKEFILGKLDGPVLHSAEQNLWWLILLILLILILLLIIIIILCCIRHRRQGKYAVYEKEKLHGCNTDVTNEEPTFGEYTKSAVPTLQAPNEGSMDSIVKPLESDSNSLAEYEETDPMKFNEDGSFIGQYGGQKKEAAIDQNAPFATIV